MRAASATVFLLVAQPPASPTPTPRPPTAAACALLRACALPVPGACGAAKPSAKYDEDRCAAARELHARGITADQPLGARTYSLLGQKYQIVYAVEDRLSISLDRLGYLLNDLPLAAKLLTHYQGVDYRAEYLDPGRRRFRASRGNRLKGEGELVSGSVEERTTFHFGNGSTTFGPWTFRGQGLMRLRFWKDEADAGAIRFRVKVVAAPQNLAANLIMNRGAFKNIVYRTIRVVLSDVSEAAAKLAREGATALVASGGWSAEEKAKLETLLRLP
ncbi:MAG TPA: hypothetical protein VGQ78_02915 [Vicinamibacteria bacterium]|nr:hypothetical protein [Vicinamibacteria bacterium]